jgi:hypothetical protein
VRIALEYCGMIISDNHLLESMKLSIVNIILNIANTAVLNPSSSCASEISLRFLTRVAKFSFLTRSFCRQIGRIGLMKPLDFEDFWIG